MLEKLKTFKELIAIVVFAFGFAFWLWSIEAKAENADKQSKINAQTNLELARIANKASSDLDLMFKLGHITKQHFEDLRMLPTTPQDENGNQNPEWYLIADTDIYLIKSLDSCCQVLKITTE